MKTALITGGNRGIGRQIAVDLHHLGWRILITSRSSEKAEEAAKQIGHNTHGFELDLAEANSENLLRGKIEAEYPVLDVLINNAGIMGSSPLSRFDFSEIEKVLRVNSIGPLRMFAAFLPLLRRSQDARAINMSSGMGEISSLYSGGYAAYRMSKTLLNAITIQMHAEYASQGIRFAAICPGWVKTDMGGSAAPRTTAQGADTAIWLATERSFPSGKFWRDRKMIGW